MLATLSSLGVEAVLHRGNISLVFLAAVLFVATHATFRLSMASAIVSFFAYNFFFTEPRFSLEMIHQEDILTVSFFLLMAAVTANLADRLRQQLRATAQRERIAVAQNRLLEKLASRFSPAEVVQDLCAELESSLCHRCFAVATVARRPVLPADVRLNDEAYSAMMRAQQDGQPAGHGIQPEYRHGRWTFFPLRTPDATLIGVQWGANLEADTTAIATVTAFVTQAELAIARLQLTQDLQQTRVDKEREQLRAALLSSVSHDLRTPLATLVGATSSLTELGDSLTEVQKRALTESIAEEARRLDRFVQNLLDMTRLGQGTLTPRKDWVSVDEMFSSVNRRLRPLLGARVLHWRTPAHVPLLHVQSALIEQALFNVLDNAIKFSGDGSTIDVTATTTDDELKIVICDEGPGVPESERERVFDMFYTVERGDRHLAGTGLGLAICRGMVEAHGGSVRLVEPEDPCRGACFDIRLPLPECPGPDDEEGV